MKVAVIGAGSWGTAISAVSALAGNDTVIWARDPAVAVGISAGHVNPRYLKEDVLPESVFAVADMATAVAGREILLLAVPAQAMRAMMHALKPFLEPGQIPVSLAKGLEIGSDSRMTEIIADVAGEPWAGDVAVLSGPNHAEEVIVGKPTTTVVTALRRSVASRVQSALMTNRFRVYVNPDVVGVEVAAATKNVIAIATGISDGLGFGDNARASLMTRGMAEMARLGMHLGGEILTFAGLAGIGDLIATCTSRHSRNRFVGERLAAGETAEEISSSMDMVAEGLTSAKAVHELAVRLDVDLPITRSVYEVVYEGRSPEQCLEDLMMRTARQEAEEVAEEGKNVWKIVD